MGAWIMMVSETRARAKARWSLLCDATCNPRTACLPTLRVLYPVLCTVENLSSFSFLGYIMTFFSSELFWIQFPSRKIFHHLQPIFISLFRSLLKFSLQFPWRLCTPATRHQSYWPCWVVPSATSTLPFVFVYNIINHNNGYLNRALPHCQTKVETAADPLNVGGRAQHGHTAQKTLHVPPAMASKQKNLIILLRMVHDV